MNIHEYQAKELLRKFGVPVPKGFVIKNIEEIKSKIKFFKNKKLVIKGLIHAGGRGKAGGIKLVKNEKDLFVEASKMLGKILITKQTGQKGKKINKLYIEEVSEIQKEYYLSCLVDRNTSKIAFITSKAGGVNIEEVAKKNPEKINTTKFDLNKKISQRDLDNIVKIFELIELLTI